MSTRTNIKRGSHERVVGAVDAPTQRPLAAIRFGRNVLSRIRAIVLPPIEHEFDNEPLVRSVYVSSLASDRHSDRNEDCAVVNRGSDMYGVFDGVGGSADGKLASEAAANVISRQAADVGRLDSLDGVAHQLTAMLASANTAVLEHTGAATTAVLARIHQIGGECYASTAHIGDSRAYLLRDGVLSILTTDHTPSNELAQQERLANVDRLDTMSPMEYVAFRQRHYVTAYLGQADVSAEVAHCAVGSGDMVILTSDGVHDNLTTTEMQDLLTSTKEADYADELTRAASRRAQERHIRAKKDDMTAVVVTI